MSNPMRVIDPAAARKAAMLEEIESMRRLVEMGEIDFIIGVVCKRTSYGLDVTYFKTELVDGSDNYAAAGHLLAMANRLTGGGVRA